MTPTFHEDLATFLQQRTDPSRPFALGDWLQALSDEAFARLRSAGAEFRARPDTADRDELLAVVLLARSAETGQLAYGGNPEVAALWINTLVLSATIEEFRRRGWIEVDRPLSIQPTVEVSIRLTPEGMKHGDEIMRRRH